MACIALLCFAVTKVIPRAVPQVTAEDARRCFFESRENGLSIVTVAVKVCETLLFLCSIIPWVYIYRPKCTKHLVHSVRVRFSIGFGYMYLNPYVSANV